VLNHQLVPPNNIVFIWPDRDCRSGFRTTKVQYPEELEASWLNAFIEAFKRLAGKGADLNIPLYRTAMNSIFKFIADSGVEYFPPVNWESHLHGHFESCLSTTQNPKSRIEIWTRSRQLYLELVRQGWIPKSTHIPSNKIKGGCLDEPSAPLGTNIERLEVPHHLDLVLPKHMLVAKGLELEDDVYLLNVKDKFQRATDAVMEGCIEYWAEMKKCHEIGVRLRESIPETDIIRVLNSGDFFKNGVHLAHPDAPDGLAWTLAIVNRYLTVGSGFSAINYLELAQVPFLHEIMSEPNLSTRLSKRLREVAGQVPPGTSSTECLTRLLGLLSMRDCAVACSMLIIENPSFTSMSLSNSDLYTQAGCYYLRARDANNTLVYSVSKPRALKRKLSALSPLSRQIIGDVIQLTAIIRAKLKAEGKKNWRKLFLFASRLRLGSSRDIRNAMYGAKQKRSSTVFIAIRDHLCRVNIENNGFTLSALRSAQAIICFLEHGSLRKVADLLGNTVRTVKKHYIPSWLIVHWASRVIRLMQQKLIIIATEGFPWQLEATDFETEQQLRLFITKMIFSIKQGDAFSQLIQTKLAKYNHSANDRIPPYFDADLAIELDVESIAAIHAYAFVFGDSIKHPFGDVPAGDNGVAIPASSICYLSKLIHGSFNIIGCELSGAESAVLDKISGDSVALFQKIHSEALQKINSYVEIFNNCKQTFAVVRGTS
jgi:hypothetical protein